MPKKNSAEYDGRYKKMNMVEAHGITEFGVGEKN